jgi:hypothetical protein
MTYSVRLSKGFITAFLASVYILGFIITPYWILHQSIGEIIFYLAITVSIGSIWLLLSIGSFQIEFSLKEIGLFLLLLVGIIALNYRPLNSVIPFRGDEASHIERTLGLMSRIPPLQSLAIIVLFLVFIIAGIKEQKWGIFVGILIVVCTIFYFLGRNSFEDVLKGPLFFLRWPFLNYWFFAALPKLVSFITSPYHEALYRIIPVLSMIGVSWIYQKKLGPSSLANNLAWGFAVATIPLIFYYSSILYIEPLAVFLMTVVCFDINNLLHKSSKDISQVPSWYALILIGFIKETTIPFLLCFIAVRMIVQLQGWSKKSFEEKSENTLLNLLVREFGVIFVLFAPAFLYLYFRATLTSTRSYTPHVLNLFDLTNYHFVILSFLQQFGSFLLLFIAGCILLIVNKQSTTALCYLSIILGILAFHIMDSESLVGYSRFNLFVLPPILAGAAGFAIWARKQKQYIGSMLALLAIGSNLLFSPIKLDGVKASYWGNYRFDTSEHYYPYQDALVWLKDNYAERRMLFTGLDFYYPFQFYWNKLHWKPKRDGMLSEGINNETIAISSVLEKAESEDYSIIVYRVIGKSPILPQELGGFHVQVIKNSAHTLLIFYKP